MNENQESNAGRTATLVVTSDLLGSVNFKSKNMKIKVTVRAESKYVGSHYIAIVLTEEDVVALALQKAKEKYEENAGYTFSHSDTEITSS